MTKRAITHDDVTGLCELSGITPYPVVTSDDNSVDVTETTNPDGSKKYDLSQDLFVIQGRSVANISTNFIVPTGNGTTPIEYGASQDFVIPNPTANTIQVKV